MDARLYMVRALAWDKLTGQCCLVPQGVREAPPDPRALCPLKSLQKADLCVNW